MKTFVVSVLTSLILMTIIFVVGPRSSISKLATRIDKIEQTVTQLETSNTQLTASLTGSLNDSLNQQTAYVKSVEEQLTTTLTNLNNTISTVKSSVQSEATQRSSDTTSLTNKINAINTSISDLSTLTNKINTLSTSLSTLSTKVSTLEAALEDIKDEVADIDSDDDLTAEITSTSGLEIDDGDSSFSGTMVVTVTNDTGSSATGIKLSFTFDADEDIPDVSTAKLTGGSITWTYDGQDGNTLTFYNKTGFSISDGNYWKKTLTLTVTFEDDVTADTSFDTDVDITDFS